MAKPPAIKMATLEQLTSGQVSLWRFMLDRQLIIYGECSAKVVATIAGLDSEAMQVLSQSAMTAALSGFGYEDELDVWKMPPSNASDAYTKIKIMSQRFNTSMKNEAMAKIDGISDHPERDQMLQALAYIAKLREMADNVFFHQDEKLPLQVVEDNFIRSRIDTKIELRLRETLVDFLVAPAQQQLLFIAYRQGELSASELTTKLLQLIEKDAEMGILSATELEEMRQALQLEKYPAGIFLSRRKASDSAYTHSNKKMMDTSSASSEIDAEATALRQRLWVAFNLTLSARISVSSTKLHDILAAKIAHQDQLRDAVHNLRIVATHYAGSSDLDKVLQRLANDIDKGYIKYASNAEWLRISSENKNNSYYNPDKWQQAAHTFGAVLNSSRSNFNSYSGVSAALRELRYALHASDDRRAVRALLKHERRINKMIKAEKGLARKQIETLDKKIALIVARSQSAR